MYLSVIDFIMLGPHSYTIHAMLSFISIPLTCSSAGNGYEFFSTGATEFEIRLFSNYCVYYREIKDHEISANFARDTTLQS